MIIETATMPSDITIPMGGNLLLSATVTSPASPSGIILFAHGSGSSRFSPRNRMVAARLNDHGFATLLLDLLTPEEERVDELTADFRFDVEMLAARFSDVTEWVARQDSWSTLGIGYFGASTGAAAALIAASRQPELVSAVVSRGGRPDLAADALPWVQAPTLLIVGERDRDVLEMNRFAASRMNCIRELTVIPGATHLFSEPGALEQVADTARRWFERHVFPEMRIRNRAEVGPFSER